MPNSAHGYDAIVVGLGALGSAALYQLARRGAKALGLDMHPQGHDKGSSHGHHRLIRRSAYRPEIDPLAERAFALWRELESETSGGILELIGEVTLIHSDAAGTEHRRRLGPTPGDLTQGGRRVLLDAKDLAERFPGFRLREGMVATWEAQAGFLRPERGIAAHLEVAHRHGAVVLRPREVTGWSAEADGVSVRAGPEVYRAARLVLAAGPWSPELLAELGLPLQVRRVVNVYFRPQRPDHWAAERGAPDFLLSVPEGSYYGMPAMADLGLKIGRHDAGEDTTARTIRRSVDPGEILSLRRVLDLYMPGASGQVVHTLTCMYTMTPDQEFILERHPRHPQVVYACGCSGTAYKFSGVIGEILADLALGGGTRHEIDFLSSGRFRG